ncbi:GNAT family N-acetyltransferase [Ferrovibrio terrae]|uniref:GNAT family N-acetyltransferase n=1 Tax=Ferrovibrio terrae TaxID=2594003 RepID=UPI003137CD0A
MSLQFRLATAADLPEIVRLLADDHLGGGRERHTDPLPPEYGIAFAGLQRIGAEVILALNDAGAIIGCLQLLILPGLGSLGKQRAQIEAVRIESSLRGKGLGSDLIRHAVARAKEKGCKMVQLTSDNSRQGAHRLYERLGFKASHVGMKLYLE